MKINKLIIRVCHFFGFKKDTYHIDDVTVHININHIDDESRNQFMYNDKAEDSLIEHIKSQINNKLSNDCKLSKICTKLGRIYTLYGRTVKDPSIIIIFPYLDGNLYYLPKERQNYMRDKKIKEFIS